MKRLLNIKGQATVEAVLMLVLGTAMVLGLIGGLNKSFSVFTEAYFGKYFRCLIENGELPALSSGQINSCSNKFKAFSLSNGRPPKNDGSDDNGDGSGGGGDGGSGGKNANGQNDSGAFNRGISESSRGGSSRFSISSGKKKNIKKSGTGKGGGNGEKDYGGSEVGFESSSSNNGVQGVTIIRIKRRSKKNRGSSELYKDPEDKKIKIKGSLKKPNAFGANNNQIIQINRTPAKIKKEKKQDSGFSFSGILRFLVIAALIIVIIIVIGGQLLSISKSFD